MKNKEKYDFTNIYFEINKSFAGKPVWNIYCNKRYVGTVDRDGVSRTQAILKWLESDVLIPPILDDKEKEFLQYIYDHIRPEILSFSKAHIDNIHESIVIRSAVYACNFLPFKINTMYNGMEINKRYTPEELGLKKRKAAFRLEDYKGISCCMHCNTEEKVKTFICFLDKEGRKLAFGGRYIFFNCFIRYGSSTCLYFNKGTIGMVDTAKSECFEILEFDDFRWERLK